MRPPIAPMGAVMKALGMMRRARMMIARRQVKVKEMTTTTMMTVQKLCCSDFP